MRTLRELGDLKNKNVLLRVDFDVPVADGKILEGFRIEKQKETLDHLVKNGAKVVMVAHISAADSFAELMPQLHLMLGHEINFLKSIEEIPKYLDAYAGPALLENIRKFPGETDNSPELAAKLARGFDLYVNNAFAVCHRGHASVSAIAGLLPSCAGFLIEEETGRLGQALLEPKAGKVVIMGGAKAETKVPVVKNFLDKADKILIGGVVANDILKEKGHDIGSSLADTNSKELLDGLDLDSPVLGIPSDFRISEDRILDIGPETEKEFTGILENATVIIWNGPMGLFENPDFAHGTQAVAKAMINSKAAKIIGGGDTITAVDSMGLLGKFDFVSTGGGAMLSFLAGEEMPGLKAIGYYDDNEPDNTENSLEAGR